MRFVIQRVRKAEVRSEGRLLGSIGKGLLLLAGIHEDDSPEDAEWCCRKIANMRIFNDEDGKMNLSARDVGGGLLVVSQFTLCANASKGNRPSFTEAASPEKAEEIYEYMISWLRTNTPLEVETGSFGTYMEVNLLNDGPVTIILDR